MTLTEAFELYRLKFIVPNDQSPKTEENHICAMKSLVAFFGDVQVESLTIDGLYQWKANLKLRNKAPLTIRSYVIKTRVVFKWLLRKRYDVVDVTDFKAPKHKGSRTINFVLPEDVQRLLVACNNPYATRMNRLRNTAIVALLFSTGLRVSELCRMDIAHVRTNTFFIEVKGGDNEVFFIDALARKHIDAYLAKRTDNNPALFVSDQTKQRVTPDNIQEIFKTLRKNTGLNVRPHVMRHSFGTDLMRNKADIRRVQELMHHKNIQTTAQYLHFLDGELGDMHQEYHTVLT